GSPVELLQSEWGLRTDEINGLLCTLMLGQLQAMGLFNLTAPGARTSVAELQARLPELYGRWVEAAVAFLVEQQFLAYETAGGAVVSRSATAAIPIDIAAAWREWEQRKAVWLEDPYKAALVVLVEATLRALPDILSGQQLATDVMYPHSSTQLIDATRQHNRVADYFDALLANSVVASVRHWRQLAGLDGRGLRVLETRAG